MTGPLETTYVEIDADTKPFDKSIDESSKKSSKKLETEFDKATKHIEGTLARAAKAVAKDLDKIAGSGDKSAVEIEAALTHAARAIEDEFQQMAKGVERSFDKVDRAAVESAVVSEAAVTLSENLSEVEKTASGVAGALGKMVSDALSSVAGFGLLAGAIVLLTPVAIALAAALAQLIGLLGILPAGIAFLVTAVVPLVIAFKNFGDAVSALASGDVKKIDEALKKLAPSARSVAREIANLLPRFRELQRTVQEAFFQPLVGEFTTLARKLLPAIRGGLQAVASAFGEVIANFLELAGQPAVLKQINSLFFTTASVIRSLMDVGPKFFKGFLDAATALGPTLRQLAATFAGLAGDFGTWLSKVSKNGQLKKWFDDATRVAGELWDLLKSIGALLGTLFGGFEASGEDTIKTLTDLVNKFNEWFKSADGQKAIKRTVDEVYFLITTLEKLTDIIIWSAQKGTQFISFIKNLAGWVKELAGSQIKGLLFSLDAIGRWATGIGGKIKNGFMKALDVVGGWVNAVIDWFKGLPGKIMTFLTALPGQVVGLLSTMANNMLEEVGIGIGLVVAAFTLLPKKIGAAIVALPGFLGTFFSNLWNDIQLKAVNAFNATVAWVQNFGVALGAVFVNLWNNAKQITSNAISAIINFVKTLPDRIASFVKSSAAAIAAFFTNIFNGGKQRASNAIDSIIGFVRNLPSKLTAFVKNVGGEIAGVIKNMLNHAISKINEGIAKVDSILPGDLPRIPQLAKGAVVRASPGGTLVNVGEGGQDEVVGPLDEIKKFFGDDPGNGGMTVNFGPGSINIDFHGVVPTPEQARQTGEQVAAGIAGRLGPRDARTMVRTI